MPVDLKRYDKLLDLLVDALLDDIEREAAEAGPVPEPSSPSMAEPEGQPRPGKKP